MSSKEITELLDAVAEGDNEAWEKLVPVVYDQLKKQARAALRRERAGHTLQSTELVHELFMRLVKQKDLRWENRIHFFKAATMALNWILVDHARHRNREGGPGKKIFADPEEAFNVFDPIKFSRKLEVLDLAIKKLESQERMKRKCQIVNMRFFSGMTYPEIAKELGVSVNTVKNDWQFAKAWLLREIKKRERYAV
jgi:RNA polymerase sigma-70 factor (ECF subfamily)